MTKSIHPGVRTGNDLTLGERVADTAVNGMGSWAFIGIQTVIVIAWIVLNLIAWRYRWDPYPFILLNLAFSTQAAYAAPLVLLAGRRQDTRSQEIARHDLETDLETNVIVKKIAAKLEVE
jgi:uncharacterized membrane protein